MLGSPGVDLPVKLADHEVVASTDNRSLYTIGNVHSKSNKDIYKFTCSKSMADFIDQNSDYASIWSEMDSCHDNAQSIG